LALDIFCCGLRGEIRPLLDHVDDLQVVNQGTAKRTFLRWGNCIALTSSVG
jgi:hypothetical protein